jgi:membrane associated rhomboid family serine protease
MFTYAALAVFIAFFGAQLNRSDLSRFYAFPWRVADGEVWRLLTATCLHGSILHVAFNAAMFVRFSKVVDDWLGPWAALGLYVFFAVSSNAAQLIVSSGPFGAVGASGVVYGLFGFLWVMARRHPGAADAANPAVVQTMLAWLVVCFVVNLFGGNIANTAHLAGLGLGWLVGQTVVARRRWRVPIALATLAAWTLPLLFSQRPVFNPTLGRVPPLRAGYWLNVSPEARQAFEDPERIPAPGVF